MKKENKLASLFGRLFGNRNKQLSFMEEEQLQSPTRMIIRNFTSNKLGMAGLIIFLCIFLFVMIGPKIFILDLSYQDNTQTNVPPTLSMLSVPEGLEGNVKDITPGTTFGVGVDNDGHVYTWGYTRITEVIDVGVIPQEVKDAHIEQIAAGYDHIAAIDDAGNVYVWGNDRLGQKNLPGEITTAMLMKKNLGFKQLEAGFQFTAALTKNNNLYL